jgi:hypothetical protein
LYNFNVDGDNTYYADNYVVHNKCFVAGTLITMEDGTYKPIEEIEVGDVVLVSIVPYVSGGDIRGPILGNQEVSEIFSPMHDGIVEYTFSDGTKTKNTTDHPYYVVDKTWCSYEPKLTSERYGIETDNFVVGDVCVKETSERITLVEVEEVEGELQTYTFSTPSKTYYANKILVHSEG